MASSQSSKKRLPLYTSQRGQLVLFAGFFIILSAFLTLTDMRCGFGIPNAGPPPLTAVEVGDYARNRTGCKSHCPVDPFVKPGLLVYEQHDPGARWVPFPLDPPQAMKSSDIRFDSAVPGYALDMACPQYMKMLANPDLEPSDVDWARNKTVLFIGSSHDRNNVQNFCTEVGGSYASIGAHTAALCNVTSHNLVLAVWFMYGVVDSEDFDWYRPLEPRPITFERKIENVMLPWMTNHGINNPDLIIQSSLFWDESFFNERSRLENATHLNAPLTYSELAWHRSRVYALAIYTRSLYGMNIPMMFRTRHIRENNRWNRILRVFQLDQNLRAAAKGLSVKLFTWGDKLEGVTSFDDGDQHFRRGPVTWLFGDMVLFYLRQATTAGCWSCHDT